MPRVVGSVTMPRIASTTKAASATAMSLSCVSPRSMAKPRSAATAWASNRVAGMIASQNCLFLMRTFQLIPWRAATMSSPWTRA